MSRHRFDPFSFIAGAVTVGVALAVLLGQVTISLVDLRLAGPVLVLALGVALLLGGGRDRSDGRATGGVAPGVEDPAADPDRRRVEPVAGDPEDPEVDAERA